MLSDAEIATQVRLRPIVDLAGARLGIPLREVEPYGRYKAKLSLSHVERLRQRPQGRLILVTAITPTPAGEGKTTTTIGLADALNRMDKSAIVCLREPSLGPCFGLKGGATGGGLAQVAPMTDINLHFTGDFHAVTTAHNLLAAHLDNHLYHGNALGIDPRRIVWRRVMDMNDRALRHLVVGLGGHSLPREDGFDLTVASEVMAVLCLADSLTDLRERLAAMLVAYTFDGRPVCAGELNVVGAMVALLKDALQPNLVQTLENNPALVHGGPFANIAHGCNSLIATRAALSLADYVVTEAGFGADLGAEKFIDIKCRIGGLRPAAAVLVASIRALKHHGGAENTGTENLSALLAGFANLSRHYQSLYGVFGLPVVVAINEFATDTLAEIELLKRECAKCGMRIATCRHWAEGGAGAQDLANAVLESIAQDESHFSLLYPDELPLWQKLETVAQRIYGASGVSAPERVRREIDEFDARHRNFPVCIAKTPYSFSSDSRAGAGPDGHVLPVREVRLARGAGFLVAICGDIVTMPGLPKSPASGRIDVSADGQVTGLF